MRLLALVMISLSAVAAENTPVESPRISTAEIHSRALGRVLPLSVVRPVVAPKRDAPVLFFLHGRGRHHRSLLDSPTAREALLRAQCYVVLPQGEDGWYIDSPAREQDRYNTYLEEVISWSNETLPVSRQAAGRGIAGWSMGGYGAVRFAQTHPSEFGFVASVIGLLDFPRAENLPPGQNYRVPVERFTGEPETWRAFNPIFRVESLRGCALTLVLATKGFDRTMNENFVAAARENNIRVNLHWLEGAHEFSVVERAISIVLADAAKAFHASEAQP
jgi:S-formylglutathione hydrolase FrmB